MKFTCAITVTEWNKNGMPLHCEYQFATMEERTAFATKLREEFPDSKIEIVFSRTLYTVDSALSDYRSRRKPYFKE